MKTKQDAVVAWLLKITPNESKESADGFASLVWDKNFRHIDFMCWNSEISDEQFHQIVSEASNRAVASEDEVASLMEHLGAWRKKAGS
jgi:hypothetical protein